MSKPTKLPTYPLTKSPSASPTFTPLPTLSHPPTSAPTFLATNSPVYDPTEEPTFNPSIGSTLPPCICKYSYGCKMDTECCPGLTCRLGKWGVGDCIEPDIYTKVKRLPSGNNCTLTSAYGCLSDSDCCNEYASCGSKLCSLFCGTSPTIAPSSAKPTRKPSKFPTASPTARPTKNPSPVPSFLPSEEPSFTVTHSPSPRPTRTAKPSTRKPTARPTTVRPTFTVTTVYPTVEPSQEPSHIITEWPTEEPTVAPVKACLCEYQQSCVKDSDCCPGLSCVTFNTYSLCEENQKYRKIVKNCTLTNQGYGCKMNTDCCNPGAICNKAKQSCGLVCPTVPTGAPVPRFPTWTPVFPYTLRPVTKFIRPTKEPTYEPTSNISRAPSQPSLTPTYIPTEEPTELPTVEPSAEPTLKYTARPTLSPSVQLYTVITFETILLIGNLTSNTKTLDSAGREYVVETVNGVLHLPRGSTAYLEDSVVKQSKTRLLTETTIVSAIMVQKTASSERVELVAHLLTTVSMSLFPLYDSNPQPIFDQLNANLTASISSQAFTTLLQAKSRSGGGSKSTTAAVVTSNSTSFNLQIQTVPAAKAISQAQNVAEIEGPVLIGLISISVVGFVLLSACICVMCKQHSEKITRRRFAMQSMEDSISDKPVWFYDGDFEENSTFNFDLNDLRAASTSKDGVEYDMVPTTAIDR